MQENRINVISKRGYWTKIHKLSHFEEIYLWGVILRGGILTPRWLTIFFCLQIYCFKNKISLKIMENGVDCQYWHPCKSILNEFFCQKCKIVWNRWKRRKILRVWQLQTFFLSVPLCKLTGFYKILFCVVNLTKIHDSAF